MVHEAILRYLDAREKVQKRERWEAWIRSAIRNLARERAYGRADIMSRHPISLDELLARLRIGGGDHSC